MANALTRCTALLYVLLFVVTGANSQTVRSDFDHVDEQWTDQEEAYQQRQDDADNAFFHWLNHQPPAYQFELTITCWCDYSGQYLFEVVDNAPLPTEDYPVKVQAQWGIIEGVFDRIQEAMDWQYQTIEVSYHPHYFYPTHLYFFDQQFDQITYLIAKIRLLNTD